MTHQSRLITSAGWDEDRAPGVSALASPHINRPAVSRKNLPEYQRLFLVAIGLLPAMPLMILFLFLFLLPLSILLGPRIEVLGLGLGAFRIQDFLMVLGILGLLVCDLRRKSDTFTKSELVAWSIIFSASVLATVLLLIQGFSLPLFYSLRLLQIPVLICLTWLALQRSGTKGLYVLLAAGAFAHLVNLIWVAVQAIFPGLYVPQSYGVGLVGEWGAFPAGQALTIILFGLVLASRISRQNLSRVPIRVGILATYLAVVLTYSRLSLAISTLIVLAWGADELRKQSIGSRFVWGFGVSFLTLYAAPNLFSRFEFGELQSSMEVRVSEIFLPFVSLLEENFILGLGPGVGREILGIEYHSVFIAVLVDFGIVGLVAFLATVTFAFVFILKAFDANREGLTKSFGLWSIFLLLNGLFTGIFQSSHITATSNHLSALILGVYLWLVTRERGRVVH